MRTLLPIILLALAACTPSLNWREVAPPESGVVAAFPCRPDFNRRPATASEPAMGLASCDADGQSFALSWAELGDVRLTGPALDAMAGATAAKLGLTLPAPTPFAVPGMTPLPQAGQYLLLTPKQSVQVAVFAHGTRVYQALLSGPSRRPEAWESFAASLRVQAR